MSKTEVTRRRKRPSIVVSNEVVEEEDNTTTKIVATEESKDVEMNEVMDEAEDKEDSQMDTVIEVKGCTPTVTVSWEEKNEEQEGDDAEKTTNASDQMTDKEMTNGEPAQTVSVSDAARSTEDAPSESIETKMEDVEDKQVKGKRKAEPTAEISPSKKTKLINDGFCLFVGNLNNSKKFEEVKDSITKYFMIQSLLVQDIRLDRSKKHAFVDLASEMDLTKALTLNGEMILDKPMKIAKAKVKSEDKVKVKAPPEDKKAAKDARCLFLKNVPYSATEKDILKVFPKAIAVRFPDGTEGPTKGIAFLEFKNEAIANQVRQHKQGAKIQDRVLIVDRVGQTDVSKVSKADDDNNNTKAAAPPNSTLFVSNLSNTVKEKNLKKVFQTAVTINIPQSKGKSRGYAFVEFATVADAEKALQSSQNTEICKRKVRVQFCDAREKPEKRVLSKTLIVMGLAKKTTAETLKSAFERALNARVTVDKETGVSKGFGFVDFESDENCKAAKEAMEDCEIDGSKVTVAYAKQKAGRPGGQPAGRGVGGGRGGKGYRGGRGREADKSRDGVKEMKNKC